MTNKPHHAWEHGEAVPDEAETERIGEMMLGKG